jgi:hypothetical protein
MESELRMKVSQTGLQMMYKKNIHKKLPNELNSQFSHFLKTNFSPGNQKIPLFSKSEAQHDIHKCPILSLMNPAQFLNPSSFEHYLFVIFSSTHKPRKYFLLFSNPTHTYKPN